MNKNAATTSTQLADRVSASSVTPWELVPGEQLLSWEVTSWLDHSHILHTVRHSTDKRNSSGLVYPLVGRQKMVCRSWRLPCPGHLSHEAPEPEKAPRELLTHGCNCRTITVLMLLVHLYLLPREPLTQTRSVAEVTA